VKKRTFYIINLDRSRIITLAILFVGFILAAFATGYRSGKKKVPSMAGADGRNPERRVVRTERNESGRTVGKSIYSLDEKHRKVDGKVDGTDGGRKGVGERDPAKEKRLLRDSDRLLDDSMRNRKRRYAQDESRLSRKERIHRLKERKKRRRAKLRRERMERRRERLAERRERRERLKKRRERLERRRELRERERGTKRDQKRTIPIRKSDSGEKEVSRRGRTKTPRGRSVGSRDPRAPLLRPSSKSRRFANTGRGAPDHGVKTGGSRVYSLQLGAFRYSSSAKRMVRSLRKQGFRAYVKRSRGKYRVITGWARSPEGLTPLLGKLRGKNFSPIIVNRKSR